MSNVINNFNTIKVEVIENLSVSIESYEDILKLLSGVSSAIYHNQDNIDDIAYLYITDDLYNLKQAIRNLNQA